MNMPPVIRPMTDSLCKVVAMRIRFGIVALAFLALSSPLQASIIAGHDYVVPSTPQRQGTNGSIEVVEFFSWGCPHCYEFYPMLSRWVRTLPKDASFKRVPVGLGHPEWETLAKAYYALQSTGDVDRLDSQIFEDIHKNHVWLYDEQSITAWVGKHGVNVAKFTEAFRSFNVNVSAGQAEQRAVDYRVPGVPTLAIAGKYTVDGDQAKMLTTSDQLIVMARAANKPSGK
jgi:protein dithiol oxidoreductase (disulfide-forming)